jgi:heptosyltransferase-2
MRKQQWLMGTDCKTVVFGAFKAMGDLLCACPVIQSELEAGNRIHLLIFNNKALFEFSQLIDFGLHRDQLTIHLLPIPGGLKAYRRFLREMSGLDPDLVWISPHAPAPASSWKIPMLLWFIQKLYWKRALLAGADSERMSYLFDHRIEVDRGLPFTQREWYAFESLSDGRVSKKPPKISFIPQISGFRAIPPLYDLLIHPGANAENRRWPDDHYSRVVRSLPSHYKIAVIGLPDDIAAMKRALPADRDIQFLTGSLQDSLIAIARCRVLLTMDSGNVHFARVLGVRAVALFGKSDPANVIPLNGSVVAIYEQKFPCQPCGKTYCSQPEVYCMNSLSPERVSQELQRCWIQAGVMG